MPCWRKSVYSVIRSGVGVIDVVCGCWAVKSRGWWGRNTEVVLDRWSLPHVRKKRHENCHDLRFKSLSCISSMKLFRMAVTSAARANKRPVSPTISFPQSPRRHRTSLTNVPTTPFESSPKKAKYQNGEKVSTKPKKAYIALGSNMGDRVAMIAQACNEMTSRGVKVTRTSSLWETEPMYVLDQERFVNGACEVS